MVSYFFLVSLLLGVFSILPRPVAAQEKYFDHPVKIPVSLSANFNELRPSHFHAGIDYRTEQRIGVPIYAAADGYLARIAVSPAGYGKVVYLNHPNGMTTVYGHLDQFSTEVAEWITSEQYRLERFAVDLTPDSALFRFAKGDLLGIGGNSGSSQAPHLHFEIRDTKTQDALNPLHYLPVYDDIPPRIYSLMVTPLSENAHVSRSTRNQRLAVSLAGSQYRISGGDEIVVHGKIGLAVHSNDFFPGTSNIFGIYSAVMRVDGQELFAYRFDRMPFADARYIFSHTDYEEAIRHNRRIHRLWRQPGNQLAIYHTDINRGVVDIAHGERRQVEIEVADFSGNRALLRFTLVGSDSGIKVPVPEHTHFFAYDEPNVVQTPFFRLSAATGAFYDDVYFNYAVSERLAGLYSKIHRLHLETVPLHLPVRINILAEDLPEALAEKAFIGRISAGGGRSYIGGTLRSGWFEADVRSFGNYAVMMDTIAPRIVPLSIRDQSQLIDSRQIRFRISDDLSGIRQIDGYINDAWVLFDYDAKYSLIVYTIEDRHISRGKRNQLKLRVTDNAGNSTSYEATFVR